jgi:hypothetical protein
VFEKMILISRFPRKCLKTRRLSSRIQQVFEKHGSYWFRRRKCVKTAGLPKFRWGDSKKETHVDEAFLPNLGEFFLLLIQRSADGGNYRHGVLWRKAFAMRENALVMG